MAVPISADLVGLGDRLRAGDDGHRADEFVAGECLDGDRGDVSLVDERARGVGVGPAHDVARADLVGPYEGVLGEAGRPEVRPLEAGGFDQPNPSTRQPASNDGRFGVDGLFSEDPAQNDPSTPQPPINTGKLTG